MIEKIKRLTKFFEALERAPPASTAAEALYLVETILNGIEDRFSGTPNNPDAWLSDGRMYPPRPDNAHDVPGRPDVTRYRSAHHNTWIGANGAIRISRIDGTSVFDKPGANGLPIGEL